MKPGRTVLRLLLTCGVIALAASLVWPREHEPEYQGKRLSEWLRWRMGEPPDRPNIRAKAIRQIGTNALPFLLQWIRYESPPWREKVSDTLGNMNASIWLAFRDKKVDRANDAVRGFQILGAQASPAVAELSQLTKSTNVHIAVRAVYALDSLGIEAHPGLLDVLTNPQVSVLIAGFVLEREMTHPNPNTGGLVRVLIGQLQHQDPEIAAKAAQLLGQLAGEPRLAVPALTNSLQAPAPRVRCCAMDALGKFGEQARSAVPALLHALD